jgi:stearoyl-CoA desaturase (delta-9 desaturase)
VGLLIWAIQMIWIPFWAAGVINGLGHWWGYKNGETKDYSRNISPWGVVIGGEELHNNHHLDPASARLSKNWYEFDIGWMWLSIFRFFKLARLR